MHGVTVILLMHGVTVKFKRVSELSKIFFNLFPRKIFVFCGGGGVEG